jgi:hypothetical protein
MTFENLANLADIVGVILIVASLIYVARELRQNTEMMRAESRNEIVHSHQQEIFALIEYPELFKALNDGGLGDADVRIHAWLTAHCRAREHEWFQLQYGALDESSWESYSSSIPIVFSGQKARAWWDFMKTAFDVGFVDHVDGLLEHSPLREHFRQYGSSIAAALSSGSVKEETR